MKKRLIRPLLAQIDDIFEEINYEFIDDSILKEVLEDSFKFLDNIFGTNER
jgi:hypothetical protein